MGFNEGNENEIVRKVGLAETKQEAGEKLQKKVTNPSRHYQERPNAWLKKEVCYLLLFFNTSFLGVPCYVDGGYAIAGAGIVVIHIY